MHPYPSASTAMHFTPVCYSCTAKLVELFTLVNIVELFALAKVRKVFHCTKSILYIIFYYAFLFGFKTKTGYIKLSGINL